MKILYVASEAVPFIASGGLADVAGSLPKAIRSRQHTCRVVLPLYQSVKKEYRDNMRLVAEFTVPLSWRNQYCGVYETSYNGVKFYFIDNEFYFKRDGLYGYLDDAERFAYFSRAVLEMLKYIDYEPDIISCNDWQTAMVPVFLECFYRGQQEYQALKTVFTIHNIQYQGKFAMDILWDILGIPTYAGGLLEYDGCLNFMKGAIETCDMITTVSPTYAKEILDPWFGYGLDRLLREKQYKLTGILNGIDLTVNDPETDPALYKNFSVDTLYDRPVNKTALQEKLGLAKEDKMLMGVVSRLTSQKGLDLVQYIFDEIVALGIQVAVLGAGDYGYEAFFRDMQNKYPGQVSVTLGFIPDLAKKIYGGSDVFLMPSKSEPCGLSQMIALRYGCLPIVRETGGLKDSVRDLGGEDGNGFTFTTYNAHDMLHAIERARKLYDDKPAWTDAVKHAMACDLSWSNSATEYIKMYKRVMSQAKQA